MHFVRGMMFCALALGPWAPSETATPALQEATSSPPVTPDPQAESILTQALSASGMSAAAPQDFVATGTIVYFFGGQESPRPVTLKARGKDQFKLEAKLSAGTRSFTVSHGNGSSKEPTGRITSIPRHNAIKAGIPVCPQMMVLTSLGDVSTGTSYNGVTEIDGRQVHNIRLQINSSKGTDTNGLPYKLFEKHVYIDAETNQILRISDKVHPIQTFDRAYDRNYDFRDVKLLGNVNVPTRIRETIAGTLIWQIQIDTITFNNGLQDNDFIPEK